MEKIGESKGKVCVTGASGFLASWLVKRLLLSGYHVIGTVRDPGILSIYFQTPSVYFQQINTQNNIHLFLKLINIAANEKKLLHLWQLEGAKERLQLVKADLNEEGSFDEAIMECHGVFHTASPVLKPASDPKACNFVIQLRI